MPLNKRLISLSLIIASSFLQTACGLLNYQLGPNLGIKIPVQEMKADNNQVDIETDNKPEQTIKFSQLENTRPEDPEYNKALEYRHFTGTGQFIKPQRSNTNSSPVTEGLYNLDFDAADIGEVIKTILGDSLGLNYIISPKVSGTVTLQTTRALNKEELIPTLQMLLKLNNAVLIKNEGIFQVEPLSTAQQSADISPTGRQIPLGFQIKLIPLKYIAAENLAEILQPVVPNNAIIKIDTPRNLLMVAGSRAELVKIMEMIKTFDVDYFAGISFGLFPLENTDVDNTLADLENIFAKNDKTPISGLIRFISIKHLNAILVATPQKDYLKKAELWIKRLDIQNGVAGEGGIVVYRVQHVDAVELAETLNEIISGISSKQDKTAPASLAPGQKLASISNKSKKTSSKKSTGKTTSKNKSYGNQSLHGVNIIADEPNNALIILAEPQQNRILNRIIKQLDVMPLQVLIDATIISVDLSDELEHGVQWQFNNGIGGDGHSGRGVLSTAGGAIATAITGGFSYGIFNSDSQLRVLFNTLARDRKVNILSTPSLVVLNNHEASIKVGDQVPIRTSQSTNTNDSNNPIQTSSIEMRDTGVLLTVKPRVNANGVVILEIDQKVDEVAASSGSEIDSPTILQRQINSTVAVVSGESIVLGGLMRESHTFNTEGIPLLKDIPYLGWLFSTKTKNLEKDELIAIITPRVIENKFDARKVTNEFKRKLSGIFYDVEDQDNHLQGVKRDEYGHEIKTSK